MTLSKEIVAFIRGIRVAGWIALIFSAILIIQLNLVISNAWATLDINTQLQIFAITLMIVLVFGFSNANIGGLWKAKKKKR